MKKREKIKLIKAAHERIQELVDKREKTYDRLLKQLGIVVGSSMSMGDEQLEARLFDLVFNNYGKAKDLPL